MRIPPFISPVNYFFFCPVFKFFLLFTTAVSGRVRRDVVARAASAETARANTPRRTNPDTAAAKSKKNLKTGQKKK